MPCRECRMANIKCVQSGKNSQGRGGVRGRNATVSAGQMGLWKALDKFSWKQLRVKLRTLRQCQVGGHTGEPDQTSCSQVPVSVSIKRQTRHPVKEIYKCNNLHICISIFRWISHGKSVYSLGVLEFWDYAHAKALQTIYLVCVGI